VPLPHCHPVILRSSVTGGILRRYQFACSTDFTTGDNSDAAQTSDALPNAVRPGGSTVMRYLPRKHYDQ
jgi:hypothetical protein